MRVLGGRRRPLALWPYEESVLSPEIALRGEVSSLSGSSGLRAVQGVRSPCVQEDGRRGARRAGCPASTLSPEPRCGIPAHSHVSVAFAFATDIGPHLLEVRERPLRFFPAESAEFCSADREVAGSQRRPVCRTGMRVLQLCWGHGLFMSGRLNP